MPLTENKLLPEDTAGMIKEAYGMAGGHSDEMLCRDGDDDFSFSFNRQARFRCNAYKQRGTLAATCRVVTFGLPNPDALHIPPMVIDLASSCRNGMVLVTGPAGSGKSTTLACMVDRINADQDVHIITIEDPIEYLHAHKRALVSQREIPNDACSFARALRAAMREAPDVIMLGEMRDYETVQTALTAAEAGHCCSPAAHGRRGEDHRPHHRYLPGQPAAAGSRSAFHGAAGCRQPAPCADGGRHADAGVRVMTVNPPFRT